MARKKNKIKIVPRRRGGKLAGPSFDNWQNLSPEAFGKLQRASYDFYYHEYKNSDIVVNFYDWMTENGYSKTQVQEAKKAQINSTAGIYARMLKDGCPDYNEEYAKYWTSLEGTGDQLGSYSDFLHRCAKKAISKGSKISTVETKQAEITTKTSTIQDRVNNQILEVVKEIDHWLDTWAEKPREFKFNDFNVRSHFTKYSITQAHARRIKQIYEEELADYRQLDLIPNPTILNDMEENEKDLWLQLKEGYSHLKKNDITKYRAALEKILSETDFIIEQAKVTRKPRKSKPRSVTKLLEKFKYCKSNEKYKIASVNPEQIIGANELWVFNVKTRKLGKYIAENIDPKKLNREGSGLSIKGTTIIGYDSEKSVQKTLRKPEEQLKEFKDLGKVALRKFLENIGTTDTKLNGRCNLDTVILKVD